MIIAGLRVYNNVVTEIGKFAILWNRFEHFHCNHDCNSRVIRKVANSISIDKEKMNGFRIALKHRIEKHGDDIIYIHQALHPNGAYRSSDEDERKMLHFINNDINEIDNIIGCLLIVQRIRNNMMHGLKDICDLNDQLELFQAANEVLEGI